MRPTKHAIISAVLGAGLIYYLKSYPAGIACLVSGVLIDLDHHIDYVIAKGKIPNYKELNNFCDSDPAWKPYLIFHSFEFLFFFWFLIFYSKLNVIWGGMAIGLTTHMICDQFANPIKPLAYSTIFRWQKKFDQRQIFTQRFFDEAKKKS